MEIVASVVIFVVLGLMFVSKLVTSIERFKGGIKGYDRCSACGHKMKSPHGIYAKTCAKCGHARA